MMKVSSDNIKFTSQIAFCPYSLSLDLYKGCPHHCLYCFAQTVHGERLKVSSRSSVSLFSFDKAIRYINGDNKLKVNPVYAYIKVKQPLHIGGMADPFPYGIEKKLHHALSFIRQVGEYPCIWSTKNPPYAYRDDLARGNHIIQFSTIGSEEYDDRVSKIEPVLPSVKKRLKKLRLLKPSLKKVVIRLQPFIPFIWTYDTLRYFLDDISNVADAVTIEFLKKPMGENWSEFGKALQYPIDSFFDKSPYIDMRSDKVFDLLYRFEMLKLLRDLIHERGMEFYSAENYFRYMSDSPACCGISEKDGELFQSKLTYSLNILLFEAKKGRLFSFSDVKDRMLPELKESAWVLSFDHRLNKRSIESVLFQRFKPENMLSPSSMFANLVPVRKNGELYYKYEEKPIFTGFSLYLRDYDTRYGNRILQDAKRI